MVILENIDIDIDKAILQNIDIDKISNWFKFGISNRASCFIVSKNSRNLRIFRVARKSGGVKHLTNLLSGVYVLQTRLREDIIQESIAWRTKGRCQKRFSRFCPLRGGGTPQFR